MPTYQSPQIDTSSSIDSNLSNEAERRGWDKASYNRKNMEPVNFYDFTRKNLNFEIKRGEPVRDKDGKVIRDKAGRTIFHRPSIIPLGSQQLSLKERYEKRLDEIGYKPWENANNNQPNTNVRIVLSGDHDRMSEIAFGKPTDFEKGADNSHAQLVKIEPDKLRDVAERYGVLDLIDTEQEYSQIALYALCYYKFLCDKFGEENVIGLCCHLDETTPHFHAWVIPVAEKMKSGRTGGYTLVDENRKPVLDEKGDEVHITTRAYERMPEEKRVNYIKTTASKKMGLSYASYFGKNRSEALRSYEKWHDIIHEEVTKKWGFDRGVVTRNLSPEDRAKHRRKSKKQLERERLLEEKKLQELMEKTAKAERNLMEKNNEIARKDQTLRLKDKDIDEKQSRLDDLENELHTDEYFIEEKEEKLRKLDSEINQKKYTLSSVTSQLESLSQKINERKNLMDKADKITKKMNLEWLAKKSIISLINEAGNKALSATAEAKNIVKSKQEDPEFQRFYFKFERIINEIEELVPSMEEIFEKAISLYTTAGSPDTNLSNTAGGVGTESNSLKRRPDEDDNAFMQRCVMACMRPKGKKSTGLSR